MSIYHNHHIIPKHMGGTDEPENRARMTVQEHAECHRQLWEDLGHWQDKLAWKGLAGMIDTQDCIQMALSAGGKIGGKIVKDKRIGIFRSEDDRLEWASMGGKASIVSPNNPWSYWASEEGRKERSSMGGKKGSFTKSDIQAELGRRGGLAKKGCRWYNDGNTNHTYTKRKEKDMGLAFDEYLKENKQYTAGRTRNENKKD